MKPQEIPNGLYGLRKLIDEFKFQLLQQDIYWYAETGYYEYGKKRSKKLKSNILQPL